MKQYERPEEISAPQAKFNALKIAFAPVVFQVTLALLKLNILEIIGKNSKEGISAADIAAKLDLSLYGVKVLLDAGLSCKLVWLKDDKYVLDKTGHFVLADSMVKVNLNFIQDVCYKGLSHLIDAVKTGKPEGLKVFGEWDTIYPAISALPEPAKTSWFEFDHYYSDKAFPEILPVIFAKPVKKLMDIGGNTGKWALQCFAYDPKVQVVIVDLPEQIAGIKKIMQQQKRCSTFAADLLDPTAGLPGGADVIWMSQFLDCFAEAQILSILQRAAAAMDQHSRLYILDLFWDRQEYEAAAFSINCISIYFTCMANGNSRMYHSKDMIKLIHKAGLYVDEDIDHIGAGHTLLGCKRKRTKL